MIKHFWYDSCATNEQITRLRKLLEFHNTAEYRNMVFGNWELFDEQNTEEEQVGESISGQG